MATIELSVVPPDTSIADAIDTLQRSRKSAIVVSDKAAGQILAVGDLMTALQEKPDQTVEVCIQQILSRPNWLEDMAISLPNAIRTNYYLAIPGADGGVRMLGTRALSYGRVVRIDGEHAQVRVARGEYAKMINIGVIICTCDKDRKHKFFPSQVTKAGRCNFGDGTLTCV
jgi:hypothetical protein